MTPPQGEGNFVLIGGGPRNDSQSVLLSRPYGSWVAYVTPAGMRRAPFERRPPALPYARLTDSRDVSSPLPSSVLRELDGASPRHAVVPRRRRRPASPPSRGSRPRPIERAGSPRTGVCSARGRGARRWPARLRRRSRVARPPGQWHGRRCVRSLARTRGRTALARESDHHRAWPTATLLSPRGSDTTEAPCGRG